MNKKSLATLLACTLISSAASASNCDNKSLSISGPEHYRYTLRLSKGSFEQKGNKLTVIQDELASPYGINHQVFSAKGSKGDVYGTAYFVNLETKESVSIPFYFQDWNKSGVCNITPKLADGEAGQFQVQAKSIGNSSLAVKIREFR